MKPDSSPNGFLESFRHARDGLVAASTGRSFRVQLAAGAAAVAVLLLSLAAATVGAIVFLPRLLALLR